MSFSSEKIKAAREAAGYTQKEMAELLGESRENYNSIENGRRKFPKVKYPTMEKLLKLKAGTLRTWRLIDDNSAEDIKQAAELIDKLSDNIGRQSKKMRDKIKNIQKDIRG